MTIRARYDGRVFVPVDPPGLPKDQLFDLEVVRQVGEGEPPRGSAAAVLKFMRDHPPLSAEAAQELERSIEEGKIPVRYNGIFDDAEEDQT
jgi:hypothetical protein